ncbi:GIY-YIG nuclease family protein [Cohnella lubricantis]|uniref:GIY-YIG nuclease family protein n=1 Tax=Cohnella lubricantis TaxID=2163172 RepID=A0A841TCJ5_9BACL|nr:GIY-YIG nuclease family protein [Cohnella lubricantis]MBB6677886.1 GIY-YIG nuclease family protein [Cohnella lubricantis]MBP2119068.1 hypothetical protein [Cohnella lubricantis]
MTIDKQKKKQLSTSYATSARPMGVYQIRNVKNGKILVEGSMDLPGAHNRLEFQKQTNTNTVIALREDWNKYGPDAFVFEVLDRIKPPEEGTFDQAERLKYKEEVDALTELWVEKLQPFGDAGYNHPKRL